MSKVLVAGVEIPESGDVYVIAEAGVNHNGSVERAHALVDVAAAAGADAVKFQTFDPAALVSQTAATTPYQRAGGGVKDQRSMLNSLVLPLTAWSELQSHAKDRGLTFLSTPFDLGSAEMLVEMGVPALKVSSGELTNIPYLRALSSLGLVLLVSTGMGTEQEVAEAVEACNEAQGLILFHCVSAYPAPIDQCNLRAIPSLSETHGVPVGWSDHTPGKTAALGAVALGSAVLEKHFTTDRSLPGPDHKSSLAPGDLADYVAETKLLARALGDGVKRRMPCEQENATLVRRSWHADSNLAAGTVLDEGDLCLLRPESGISPAVDIRGRVLLREVPAGAPITESDLLRTGL